MVVINIPRQRQRAEEAGVVAGIGRAARGISDDVRVYIYIYIYIYIISDQIGDKKILMAYRKSFTSFWLVFSLIEIMINNKNSSSF